MGGVSRSGYFGMGRAELFKSAHTYMLLIITSTGDKLLRNVNIDDLE